MFNVSSWISILFAVMQGSRKYNLPSNPSVHGKQDGINFESLHHSIHGKGKQLGQLCSGVGAKRKSGTTMDRQ